MTVLAVLTGGLAGLALGFVLQRGQLCFHSTFAGVYGGRWMLVRAWLLGVALASVGLALLFGTPLGDGLDRGLPFTPGANVAGGLLVGIGMVVAASCVSGLFYKLGEGMLGAVVGLAGWAAGELLARALVPPLGPTLLPPGDAATVPGVLGLPRPLVAVVFLAVVCGLLWRTRRRDRPERPGQWAGARLGVALGAATVAGWVLASLGGSPFGPSSVGAATSVAVGAPNWWLLAFLLGIVAGGTVGARVAGQVRVRGEHPVRYGRLATGGALLGAGGWIGGGCNLGHGLSGVAQLNVSSWVVVASIVAGIGLARAVSRSARRITV